METLKLHKILLGVGIAVMVALVVALVMISKKSKTLLRRRNNLRKDLTALRQKYEADTKALKATHSAQIQKSEAIVASDKASRAQIVKATEDAKTVHATTVRGFESSHKAAIENMQARLSRECEAATRAVTTQHADLKQQFEDETASIVFACDQAAAEAESYAQMCLESELYDNEFLEERHADLSSLRDEINTLDAELALLLDSVSAKSEEIASLEAQMDDLELEYTDSWELVESYEGTFRNYLTHVNATCNALPGHFPEAAFRPQIHGDNGPLLFGLTRQKLDMCGRNNGAAETPDYIREMFVDSDSPPDGYGPNDIFTRLTSAAWGYQPEP